MARNPVTGNDKKIKSLHAFEQVTARTSEYRLLDLAYKEIVVLAKLLAERNRLAASGEVLTPIDKFGMELALSSLTAMLAAVEGKCQIDPPPAPITAVTNASGNLVYQCSHETPHKWKLDGTLI
jgi:hypothetical protein